MNSTERQREIKETGEGNSGDYDTAHSLHAADKGNTQCEFLASKTRWESWPGISPGYPVTKAMAME